MIRVDLSGLNEYLHELGDAADAAARPAAQAAAQVLYDEVKKNVQAIGAKTGNLSHSIYQVYSGKASGQGLATYAVSWNHRKAPHGHLLEWGYIQRYEAHIGKNGQWHTIIRPEKQGTPKPGRRASQAEKDAYYVLRPGGPVQRLGKAFVRRATSKFPEAAEAAKAALLKAINDR